MPPKGISKAKPFKPPRPSTTPKLSKSKSTTSTSRRASTKAPKSKAKAKGKETASENSGIVIDDDENPFTSSEIEAEAESGQESEPERAIEEPDEPEITIQPELLTKILHEFFTADGGMRISKDASKAVGKYMHTFVQEALHRAAAENREEAEKSGGLGGNDMFLEVEDLEKLSPQMLLDF